MKPLPMTGEGATQGGGQGRRRPVETLPVVVPNRWQGEIDCAVGPFSSRNVASYFANRVVDFGHYEVFTLRVFAHRDGWYVEVHHRERSS
ncbi:MAG: hypothetical protein P8Y13_03965 [Deinococcales bacterium]|jgi:hypothetical protein